MRQQFRVVSLVVLLSGGLSLTAHRTAAAPVIIQQPRGTSVLAGSTVNLAVSGTGTGTLGYQWLRNAVPISTSTSSSLSLINIQLAGAGDYQVILDDSSGSVTSRVATVTVLTQDLPGLTNDLVAHYRFEQNLRDNTSHGNDGTGQGSPTYTPSGRTGGAALAFDTAPDGSQIDYVSLGIPDDFAFGTTNDFSVSFWLRFSTPNGEFPIIANRDWSQAANPGWGIAVGPAGQLRWRLAGPPAPSKSYDGEPGVLSDGAWHHVAVVFQRSAGATTYLDGAVVDVQSLAGTANDLTTPPGLSLNVGQDGTGAYTGGGNAGLEANLDDLGLWRRALTLEEAALIYAKGVRAVDIEQPVFTGTGGEATQVTGQWDFDQGDLRATVGQPLEFGDSTMAGQTSFGTTTSFGIPDIGGQPAKIMKYTRNESPPDNYVAGYAMHPGIDPNGGGTLVNQWTLIADMLIPDLHQGDGYTAVIEIQNDPNSDADISIHEEAPGVAGIGISGQYPGNITAGQWHRIVVAVDLAAQTPVISKFVDGALAGNQTDASGIGLDGRFALSDVAHLFSDGEHDNEVSTYYVNSVQIRSGKLSDADVAALGGAQAAGIPSAIPSGTELPRLSISLGTGEVIISWDAAASGFALQTTATLNSPNWTSVPGVSGNSAVVKSSAAAAYFRLAK